MNRFIFRERSLELGRRTYVMGILNVTPDSFSDGGLFLDPEKAVRRAEQIREEGADILDIGAQSTRPGHTPVSPDEEWSRLAPVLTALEGRAGLPISVDTYYPEVAARALAAGADIINDVSGEIHPEMFSCIAEYRAGYIAMHTGSGDADHPAEYPDGVFADVRAFFERACRELVRCGVLEENICLDVGIGFGKTQEQNLALLRDLKETRINDCALLVGASRKRVVAIPSGESEPQRRMPGTVAAHTAAIAGGADIIRVHDVWQSVQAARVADAIYRTAPRSGINRQGRRNIMDKIIVKGLEIFAYHGVNPEEKENGQPFIIDAECALDLTIPCASDRVEDTVSYAKIVKTLTRVMTENKYDLIERAAQVCADAVLWEYPAVMSVRITLKKPQAPIQAKFECMAVEIERHAHQKFKRGIQK